MSSLNIRTGIDLIEIERIENLTPAIRARFIQRVYTMAEQALCSERNERLAGRFACKEAVSKALGTGIGKVGWRDIEILQDKDGAPLLILHSTAQIAAEQLGLSSWSISISHTKKYATAIAVAYGEK